MRYRPKKMQFGGVDPLTGLPIPPQLKQSNDPNYNWTNFAQTQTPVRQKVEGEDLFQIHQGQAGTPNPFEVVTPKNKKKNAWGPYLGMRAATLALTELSGKTERNRQDEYMYQQMSTLGQMNPMPVENFQPNPFSMYARYGGSLKKYMNGKK